MFDLYRAIWTISWRRQLVLIALSLAVAALAAVPLEYQRTIVNNLRPGVDPVRLYWAGAEMMAVILLSLGLKGLLGYLMGTLGESTIRRIRARVYSDYADRPTDDIPHVERGTIVTTISAEAEDLGKFTGDAIAEPLMQIGTLISVIGYIAATEPALGVIAALVVLPQAIIVIATQRGINRRVRTRVQTLRHATDAAVDARVGQVHREVLDDFDRIYETRREIFFIKLSTKFVLSTINSAGSVGVLMLGGYLVIQGDADVGIVVAALSGLAKINQPWRSMVGFYRNVSAMQVKFVLLSDVIGKLSPSHQWRIRREAD